MRVVFGVSACPFLLSATLDHHMARFESIDPPLYTNSVDPFMWMTFLQEMLTVHMTFMLSQNYVWQKQILILQNCDKGLPKMNSQVLGVRWNVTTDHSILDVSDIYLIIKDQQRGML